MRRTKKPKRRTKKPHVGPQLAPAAPPRSPLLVWLCADSVGMLAFRGLVVAMQAATILITWQLWQARSEPPLLPMLTLPQFDMGPWLLASLVVVLAVPRLGLALHFTLLGCAMLQDEMRTQPEFVSMALLMLGTISSPAARFIARAHLLSLWFYAGFHKLISVGYYTHDVPGPLIGIFGENAAWPQVFDIFRGGAAMFEMTLGVLVFIPRTRKWCAWLALLLHIGILQYLMFWVPSEDGSFGWNTAVWPWNVALALAGFALIWPWRSTVLAEWRQVRWLARGIALVLVVSPIGFYNCWVHPYFAHCLYSNNTPIAAIVTSDGDETILGYLTPLNVPFPPLHRVYEAYFDKVAKPGDLLIIRDFRKSSGGRRVSTHLGEMTERRIRKPIE